MITIRSLIAASTAVIVLCASAMAFADSKAEIDASVNEAIAQFEKLEKAHAMLAHNAVGMLVFPRITKGGVGVSGEYGEGVLQVDGKTVDYYSVTSASIGLTLGMAKRSEIILFNTQAALDKFTKSEGWSIGADAGVALASHGAGGSYDSQTLKKPIVGFVFGEKGLIADLSLEGSKINKIDK
jgi:lipid-binding SYLF domain-containing protein